MIRDTVLLELRDGIAVVTWNRPRQRNAFNRQMWCEARYLARSCSTIRGRASSSSRAPARVSPPAERDAAAPGDAEHPFGSSTDVLVAFDKPLLAAVNGVGVGIGLTMLLHGADVVHVA